MARAAAPVARSVGLRAACRDRALIPLQPHPGQDELLILAEQNRFLFAACGRRFGKSRWAAAVALHNLLLTPEADALVTPGETRYAVVVANSREQAGVVLEHAVSLVRSSRALSHELVDQREHELRFRGNRSFLALPCNARSIRGLAVSCVVFDEAAHYADDEVGGPRTADRLWNALTPSVAQFGAHGRVVAISTPAGTSGLFAELFAKARGGEIPEACAYSAPTSANPHVDPAFLVAQEAALGPEDYDREFNAIFSAGGLGFFDLDRVRECVGDWKEVLPADGKDWRCAIDPAFSRDPFGLAIVGRRRDDLNRLIVAYTTRWLAPKPKRRIIRSRKEETSHIEAVVAEVAAICGRYGVTRLTSDQHLPGVTASEFAKHGINVKIAAWTDDSKTAAMRSLRALINTSRIELPDDPVLLTELGRVRTKPGRDKIETPRSADSHCDVALSAAAAVLDHEQHPVHAPARTFSPFSGGRRSATPVRHRPPQGSEASADSASSRRPARSPSGAPAMSARPLPLVYATFGARRDVERFGLNIVVEQGVASAIERGHIQANSHEGVVFLDQYGLIAKVARVPGRMRPRPRGWLVIALKQKRKRRR